MQPKRWTEVEQVAFDTTKFCCFTMSDQQPATSLVAQSASVNKTPPVRGARMKYPNINRDHGQGHWTWILKYKFPWTKYQLCAPHTSNTKQLSYIQHMPCLQGCVRKIIYEPHTFIFMGFVICKINQVLRSCIYTTPLLPTYKTIAHRFIHYISCSHS